MNNDNELFLQKVTAMVTHYFYEVMFPTLNIIERNRSKDKEKPSYVRISYASQARISFEWNLQKVNIFSAFCTNTKQIFNLTRINSNLFANFMPLTYVCPKRWHLLLQRAFVGLITVVRVIVLSRQCGTRFCRTRLGFQTWSVRQQEKEQRSGALTRRGLAATTRCRFTELNPTYLSGSERLPIQRVVVNMEVNRYPEASLGAKESLNPSIGFAPSPQCRSPSSLPFLPLFFTLKCILYSCYVELSVAMSNSSVIKLCISS